MKTLNARFTYLTRELIPGARMVASLYNASIADAPSDVAVIATTEKEVDGPSAFTLTYDSSRIDPLYQYALSVSVYQHDQLHKTNHTHCIIDLDSDEEHCVEVQPVG